MLEVQNKKYSSPKYNFYGSVCEVLVFTRIINYMAMVKPQETSHCRKNTVNIAVCALFSKLKASFKQLLMISNDIFHQNVFLIVNKMLGNCMLKFPIFY